MSGEPPHGGRGRGRNGRAEGGPPEGTLRLTHAAPVRRDVLDADEFLGALRDDSAAGPDFSRQILSRVERHRPFIGRDARFRRNLRNVGVLTALCALVCGFVSWHALKGGSARPIWDASEALAAADQAVLLATRRADRAAALARVLERRSAARDGGVPAELSAAAASPRVESTWQLFGQLLRVGVPNPEASGGVAAPLAVAVATKTFGSPVPGVTDAAAASAASRRAMTTAWEWTRAIVQPARVVEFLDPALGDALDVPPMAEIPWVEGEGAPWRAGQFGPQ